MNTMLKQIRAIWDHLETPQRVSLIMIIVVFGAIVGGIIYGTTRPDYRVLASELSNAKTAEIAAYLQSQNIAYKTADRETTILVPSAQLYALRNELAEQEMLSDDSTGFELLSESQFGESSFKEQKNYDRAVAGELERSYRELSGVKSARVIIVRPPSSPFLDDDRKPSASVKLDMSQGRSLTQRQISGVVHLATGAVEGLLPENVQVMDNNGLLTNGEEDPLAMSANNSLEAERSFEKHLAGKAQKMLDRVLGPGRSMVNVAVDLDFDKETTRESAPNPNSVILRQTNNATDGSTPVPTNMVKLAPLAMSRQRMLLKAVN